MGYYSKRLEKIKKKDYGGIREKDFLDDLRDAKEDCSRLWRFKDKHPETYDKACEIFQYLDSYYKNRCVTTGEPH